MHATSSEPAEPSAATVIPPPPRAPRRFFPRRWSLRVLLIAAIFIVIAIVATQLVLWSNVPRDLVLGQLQKQLGLRVSAASLSTGWLGNTQLHDVAIALPLSDDALAKVPEMRVKHTSLFGLLLTRSIALDLVELDRPHLLVRQDAAGRWNVQQVAELLARAAGKQTAADQAKKTSRPTLPRVRIIDATIDVVDRGGRTTSVTPVTVIGEPENALTWKYDARLGPAGLNDPNAAVLANAPQLRATGRLVTGGNWAHEVQVTGRRVEGWAKPWAAAAPAVSFRGEWKGELRPGPAVAGRLVLAQLDVAGMFATGAVAVTAENGSAAIRPENLLVKTGRVIVPEWRITGGTITLDAKSAAANQLTVLTFDGAARVDGRYDWATGSADLQTNWSDFAVPGKNRITHSGTLTASLRNPFPGRPVIAAELTSTGKMVGGGGTADAWDANLTLGGTGDGWANVDWEFQAKRLSVAAPMALKLDGLAASVQTRGWVIALTSVRGPGEVTARGRGQYDLASQEWNLRLDVGNLPRAAALGRQGPSEVSLNARGTPEYVMLDTPGLSLRGAEAELRVEGSYVFNIPKPVDFNVYVNHIPPRNAAADQPPLFGYLRGEAHVVGTAVAPTDLTITGNLVGRDMRFYDRSIGDVQAGLTGRVEDVGDNVRVTLQTTKLQMLGGEWQLDALFPENGVLAMNLNVTGLPLAEIGDAIKRPGLAGTVDARWAVIVPRLEAEAVKVSADIKARDLKYQLFTADTLEATAVLADGTLKVEPVRLCKGDGTADVTAELDVREFRRVTTSLALAAWPFEPSPGTKAELWGGTRGLRVSLPGAKREEGVNSRGVFRPESRGERVWITGPLDVRANLTLKDQPAGTLGVVADVRGRTLDLRSLSFDGVDGTLQGEAMVDFDRPLEARGAVYFEDFNAERLPEFFPEDKALVGLAGRFGGRARFGPAPGPRPLEPLRIQADVSNRGGRYRTVDIGPIRFSAFTNLDRLVIQDSPENPTTIEMAGGLVRVWGRLSLLQPGDELNPAATTQPMLLSQAQVSFGGLNLDQVVHAFKPDAEPMPGKLAGSFTTLAGTRPRHRAGAPPSGQGVVEKVVRRITADGRVELTESNLANLDVVAALYSALSFAPGGNEGHGDVTFHMEDGLLSLNNVHYFNRGTELRAVADIDHVWTMPDSPLSGTAAGTARPLRDVKLPFLSSYSLDTLFTALQGDLATVGLSGTVHDPKVDPLAFKDVGEGMRNLLVGDYNAANRSGTNRAAAPGRR